MPKRPKRNAKKSDKKKPAKSKGKKKVKKIAAKVNSKRNKKRVGSNRRLGQKKAKKIVRRPSKPTRKRTAKRSGSNKRTIHKLKVRKKISKKLRKKITKRVKKTLKHYPITWKKIQDKDLTSSDYKVLEIDLSQIPEPHEKLEAIRTAKIISELTYLYNRDKRENGSIRYPRNVLVFAEIDFPNFTPSINDNIDKEPSGTGTRWICISTLDRSFVPTPGNVRRLIHQSVQEYYDEMKEKIEVDYNEKTEVYEILKVSVRFLYQTGQNRDL